MPTGVLALGFKSQYYIHSFNKYCQTYCAMILLSGAHILVEVDMPETNTWCGGMTSAKRKPHITELKSACLMYSKHNHSAWSYVSRRDSQRRRWRWEGWTLPASPKEKSQGCLQANKKDLGEKLQLHLLVLLTLRLLVSPGGDR